ncbi:class I SAM-dependent methyltransferase [Acinetobacter sp. B5B]|uniref:SAM-dependent methyltransferase n=1 Tax=Acinetobacter baretiae TaxID=2605383 RepID=UPI0018C2E092|nr:class I SAM-dependent methyltransferase [Acinetobacter baretiae]MBF7682563.1 class I SAM-dependent methyltransferase [Acinetobacter baretiae]
MLKPWSHRLALQHKYAISATMLGDSSRYPWTNLGLWLPQTSNYVQACQQLAMTLANQLQLCATDRVLDLGCGQGASLVLWQQHYAVQHITAIELQAESVEKLQGISDDIDVYQSSFLSLQWLKQQYDVIMCIDALYHSALSDFFMAIQHLVSFKTRVGFHYLLLNERGLKQTWLQQKKYQYMLKAANITFAHLETADTLQQLAKGYGYDQLNIQVMNQDVFAGFAQYVSQQSSAHWTGTAGFKIKMTAQLCQTLYQEGMLDYVQVTLSKCLN